MPAQKGFNLSILVCSRQCSPLENYETVDYQDCMISTLGSYGCSPDDFTQRNEIALLWYETLGDCSLYEKVCNK